MPTTIAIAAMKFSHGVSDFLVNGFQAGKYKQGCALGSGRRPASTNATGDVGTGRFVLSKKYKKLAKSNLSKMAH
jgi:hypothetical protein